MSSVLIRGGLVVDGTGRAAFPADVLVEGDRIADVIDRPGRVRSPSGPDCIRLADTVIDATGCLVTRRSRAASPPRSSPHLVAS